MKMTKPLIRFLSSLTGSLRRSPSSERLLLSIGRPHLSSSPSSEMSFETTCGASFQPKSSNQRMITIKSPKPKMQQMKNKMNQKMMSRQIMAMKPKLIKKNLRISNKTNKSLVMSISLSLIQPVRSAPSPNGSRKKWKMTTLKILEEDILNCSKILNCLGSWWKPSILSTSMLSTSWRRKWRSFFKQQSHRVHSDQIWNLGLMINNELSLF